MNHALGGGMEFSVKNLMAGDHLADLGFDGKTLWRILKKEDLRVWNEFKQLRTAANGGFVHTYGRFMYTMYLQVP